MSFASGSLNYGALTTDQGVQAGSVAHRRAWEAGHVDYHGRDSFSNIQEQLEKNIAQQQQQYHPSQQRQTTPPQFVFLLLLIQRNIFFYIRSTNGKEEETTEVLQTPTSTE